MKLTDIAELVLLDSGQFLYTTENTGLEELGIKYDRYWRLVRRCLSEYQKYIPETRTFNVTTNNQIYTFPDPSPKWVSSCIPINTFSTVGLSLFTNTQTSLSNPRSFLWTYERPILRCIENGNVEVIAHYDYQYEIIPVSETDPTIADVDIPNLGESNLFIDYVTARTLIAVGRSRRAFTTMDFPVSMDAMDMTSDGLNLLSEISQRLADKGIWYTSIGC